jgi:hypothetical protein
MDENILRHLFLILVPKLDNPRLVAEPGKRHCSIRIGVRWLLYIVRITEQKLPAYMSLAEDLSGWYVSSKRMTPPLATVS